MTPLQLVLADGTYPTADSFDAAQGTVQVRGQTLRAESCVFKLGELNKGQMRRAVRLARNNTRGVHMARKKKAEVKANGEGFKTSADGVVHKYGDNSHPEKIEFNPAPTQGLDIRGAAIAMASGKWVARKSEGNGTAIRVAENGDIVFVNNGGANPIFGAADFLANDWEIIGPEKPESIPILSTPTTEKQEPAKNGPMEPPKGDKTEDETEA